MADIVDLPKPPAAPGSPGSAMATVLQFPDRGPINWRDTEVLIRNYLLTEEGHDKALVDQVCSRLREVGRDPCMVFSVSKETAAASAEVIRYFHAALSYLVTELVRREIEIYELENGHGKPPPQAA